MNLQFHKKFVKVQGEKLKNNKKIIKIIITKLYQISIYLGLIFENQTIINHRLEYAKTEKDRIKTPLQMIFIFCLQYYYKSYQSKMDKIYEVEEVFQNQNYPNYPEPFSSETFHLDNWYLHYPNESLNKFGVANQFTMFSRDEINRSNPGYDLFSEDNICNAQSQFDYPAKQTAGGVKTAHTYNQDSTSKQFEINKDKIGYSSYNEQMNSKDQEVSSLQYCFNQNSQILVEQVNKEDSSILQYIFCETKVETKLTSKPLFNVRTRKFLNIEVNKAAESKYLKTSYGKKDDTIRLQINFKNINLRILNQLKQEKKIDQNGLELISLYENSKENGFDITKKLFGLVHEQEVEEDVNIVKVLKNADPLRIEVRKKYSSSELVREIFKIKVAFKLKLIMMNYIQVVESSVIKPENHMKWKKMSDR